MKNITNRLRIAAFAAAICVAVSGCAGEATSGGGSPAKADVAAAEAAIAPYVGQPSKFPLDTPLEKKPTGKSLAFVDCGTPVCGLFYTLAEPAAQAMGMKLTRIKATMTADSIANAFDTVVQEGYDGVFVPAIPLPLWERSLAKLNAAGVPVVTSGVTDTDPSKIPVAQIGNTAIDRSAKLLASYVVAKYGADANVAFYSTPELSFSTLMDKTFAAEMKRLCPGCQVRSAKIPVASFGTKAPSLVVDDLQAHPDTSVTVFAVGEQAAGLPAALKTAALSPKVIANSPDPVTLQYIKDGQFSAGFGLDIPVVAWTLMDSLGRLATGATPASGAVADIAPQQFLTKDELTGDVSHGWVGYQDFAQKFTQLWSAAS
jgi:ribose transport system substrate-binding protein